MNKKILGAIIVVIVIIIAACGIGYVIHEKDVQLKQAQLQQQKITQELKAQQAKEKAEQQAKEKAAEQAKQKAEQQAKEQTKKKATASNQATMKAQFLDEMAVLKPENPFPGGHLGIATQQGLLYQTWDAELNKIWGALKNTLPKSQMDALTKDEENWISQKQPFEAGYNNGDPQDSQTLAQMTKERCYYLVNNYM